MHIPESAYGVKGYILWCTYQKAPRMTISSDVKFNESTSLENEKEKTIAETDHSVSDEVELEIESPSVQLSNSEVKRVEEVQNFD